MRLLLLVACFLYILPCRGQSFTLDELLRRLKTEKDDTNKVYLYIDVAYAYAFTKPDSDFIYTKAAEELSIRLNFTKGQASAIAHESGLMTFEGNYPQGLRLGLSALRIADECGDPVAEVDALNSVGTLYYFQNDYRRALIYYLKSVPFKLDGKNAWKHERALGNIGDTYQVMGITDSALYFSSQAYEIAKRSPSYDKGSDELNNLGSIYATMGRDSLAHVYFALGLNTSQGTTEFDNYCTGALGDAELFWKEGLRDSALMYAYLDLGTARISGLRERELEADKFIATLYDSEGKIDSSYKYLKRTVTLQDILYSQERLKAIQNLTFEENTRQQDLASERKKAEERNLKNLQLIAIALFIPVFFLLVVFLYRIKVKPRIIEFLAIMNLLLVFEFVTDLTFPIISDWSNESPLWEMLILVLIASILEPLNFKVESWLKRKLGTSGQIGSLSQSFRSPQPEEEDQVGGDGLTVAGVPEPSGGYGRAEQTHQGKQDHKAQP